MNRYLDLVVRHGTSHIHTSGIHGHSHWERVAAIGAALARRTGADPQVVEAFAYLHDSHRHDDGHDEEHGPRAASFLDTLTPRHLGLSPRQFDLLREACAGHTVPQVTDEVTIGTCWDADRLDLMRLDISPDPELLSTAAACDEELIAWAYDLSRDTREELENEYGGPDGR